MMRKSIFSTIMAMLMFVALAGAPAKAMGHGDHDGEASHHEMAPAFTATTAAGETISLEDFKGQPVVLEWINFDCPYVKKHYNSGNMQALQERYVEEGVAWITINSSAEGKQGHFTGDELKTRMEDNNINATHYVNDVTGEIGKAYDAKTTPHMYVISKDGHIVYQGAIDSIPSADKEDVAKADNYVVAALEAYMAGEDIATPKTQPYGCSVKY